jgi:hypothetical protein
MAPERWARVVAHEGSGYSVLPHRTVAVRGQRQITHTPVRVEGCPRAALWSAAPSRRMATPLASRGNGSIIGDGPPRTSVLLIHDQIGRGEIGEWDDPAAYPLFLGGSRVRPPDLRLFRAAAWRMTAGLAQRGGAQHRCRTRRRGTAAALPTSTCSPRLTARGHIPRYPR